MAIIWVMAGLQSEPVYGNRIDDLPEVERNEDGFLSRSFPYWVQVAPPGCGETDLRTSA